jgi:Uma2 family endonuclease
MNLLFNLHPVLDLTDEQFLKLCQNNRDLRLERTAQGELMIMPPTDWTRGNRNARLTQRLMNWSDTDGTGVVFAPSTGFKFPNGPTRSPDAAWVLRSRIEALNLNSDQLLPLAPDFAVELRSATDELDMLRAKMIEYLKYGVRLGWLLNFEDKQVEIFRKGQSSIERLKDPVRLSGENVLTGFVLHLSGFL